jgi:hypothetical protein
MISAGVSISESGAPIWVGGRDIENQLIVFGLAPRMCGGHCYGNSGRRTSAGGFDAQQARDRQSFALNGAAKADEQREKGSGQDPSLMCSGADAGLAR